MSAHVQYKEAFISSRLNAPARGACSSASRKTKTKNIKCKMAVYAGRFVAFLASVQLSECGSDCFIISLSLVTLEFYF